MDEAAINTMLSFSDSEEHLPAQWTTTTGSTQSQASTSTSTKTIPSSKPITTWTDEMNIMLCREVEMLNPFKFKDRTKERGKVWDEVAENLKKHGMNVNKRSVRDRFNLIKTQVIKKNREEAKASGIAPDVTPTEMEITSIIEDIVEHEQETKEQQAELRQKEDNKVKDGVEMRKRALETFTETNKRIKGEKDGPSRKRRNTGSDANEFLLRKIELQKETQEQELQFRRDEADRKRQFEEKRMEMEERREERQREREEREEKRRIEREDREEERRRQEEETRRKDREAREKQMELFQQQMLQQSQMLMLMLSKGKKEQD